MPDTIEAVIVAIVAIVPGLVATSAFRAYSGGRLRPTSTDTDGLPERLISYLVLSVLLAPLTLTLALNLHDRVYYFDGAKQRSKIDLNTLSTTETFFTTLLVIAAYVGIPAGLGLLAA